MTYQNGQIPIRYQNALFLVVIGLIVILGSVGAWLFISYRNHKQMQVQQFKDRVEKEMHEVRSSMQKDIAQIATIAMQVLPDILHKSDDEAFSYFKKVLQQHPHLYALGVAYEPNQFNHTTKLHGIISVKKGRSIEQLSLENFYDYTQLSWFKQELPEQGAWLDPYKDSVTNAIHVRYAIPFFSYDNQLQQRVKKGVFFLDLNLESIKNLMEVRELKDAQYALLIARDGTVLYFPGILSNVRLKDINPLLYKTMEKVEEQAKHQEGGSIAYYDPASHREYQMFYEPLPGTSWLIGLVFEYRKSIQDVSYIRRQEIAIVLNVTMLICLLITLLTGIYRAGLYQWWILSITSTLFIFIAVAIIIFLDRKNLYEIKRDRVIINTLADLQRFTILQAKEKATTQVLHVPTGIYIKSLSADTSDVMTLRGLVWQKYNSHNSHDQNKKGIYIGSPDETQLDLAYEQNGKSPQKMGWHFKTQLTSEFDYLKYPFDKQEVSLTINDKNFVSDKILIPDFDSYDFTGRTSLLGLGKRVKLEGWYIYQSYFDYLLVQYPTTFGVLDAISKKMIPNLQFTIRLERNFVNPLIAGFLPIVIVWFLSFAVLLITSLAEATSPVSRILSFIGTLFFSVVLAHLRLKTTVPSITISYMEYIYFLTYVIIFLSSVNCLAYKLSKNVPIVHTHNNIIIKLLYWPMIALSVLGITLAIFY